MKYGLLFVACTVFALACTPSTSSSPAAEPKQPVKAAAKPKPEKTVTNSDTAKKPQPNKTDKKEVVFDPKNPPAGFTICHRNHCHRQGGGVASYAQVMKEIGATKSINVPKRAPMPKAPADVAGPSPDAILTGSGIASKVLKAGTGKVKPKVTDIVTVHYTGGTTDGRAFDSSIARGEPATFPLSRVIPGWSEGVQLMTVGEERRLWIPEHLAYKGRKGAPQGMLVFDIELISIK